MHIYKLWAHACSLAPEVRDRKSLTGPSSKHTDTDLNFRHWRSHTDTQTHRRRHGYRHRLFLPVVAGEIRKKEWNLQDATHKTQDTGTQAHRHTGTQAHRHTGTPAHRHTGTHADTLTSRDIQTQANTETQAQAQRRRQSARECT